MLGRSSPPSHAANFSGLVCKLAAASSMENPAVSRAHFQDGGVYQSFCAPRHIRPPALAVM